MAKRRNTTGEILVLLMDNPYMKLKELAKEIKNISKPAVSMGLNSLKKKGLVYNDALRGWYISDEGVEYIKQNQSKLLKATDKNLKESFVKPAPVEEPEPDEEVADSAIHEKFDEVKHWQDKYFEMVEKYERLALLIAGGKSEN